MIVNGLSIALFFVLAKVLDVPDTPLLLGILAWMLFVLGLLFIILSVAALAANRNAGLSDRGVYGIVRHPMYLGAILLFVSWIGFLPHWIVGLLSLANSVLVYRSMRQGERRNIEKFGESYRRYMAAVPRANLFKGLLRRLRTTRSRSPE